MTSTWAWAWAGAGAGACVASLGLALLSPAAGNVAFVVGALFILASVFFIGFGGERRFRIVRSLMGAPVDITHDPIEPGKRQWQISTGVKVFLLGLAIWAPLAVLALR